MPKLVHSASSIKMFEDCPYKYYRMRVVKDVADQPSTASIYGERVHKQLEDFAKTGEATEEIKKDHTRAYNIISQFRHSVNTDLLAPEVQIGLSDNLLPCGWLSEEVFIRAKIDLLIITNLNNAMVIDWKTGRIPSDSLQADIYTLAVYAAYPSINKVVASMTGTSSGGNDPNIYINSHNDVIPLSDKIFRRINRIQEAVEHDVWQAKPGYHCRWCPCKRTCSFAV